jgi:hypothetical protein
VVRQLPGLDGWDYIAAWGERLKLAGDVTEGISPDDADRKRARRARVLAGWLNGHAGSPIAERVVVAAERVAVAVLEVVA